MRIPKIVNINKELLLEKYSEETYMEYYLGVKVGKGLILSPLRVDKSPTASFYRNKGGSLVFHDFGNGFHGNFIAVVMELYQLSYYKAIRKIAKDFGMIEGSEDNLKRKIVESKVTITKQNQTIISVVKKEFSETELKWWSSFGILKHTLDKFKVCSCEQFSINGRLFTFSSEATPIYGYYGGLSSKNELWRMYFPSKKKYRFISNYTSKYIQGIKQLPKSGEYLVITKSLKDVMVLYEYGIPAIAPNGEGMILSEFQMNRLKNKFKKILILFDNDQAGVIGANRYKKAYNLPCIFIRPKYSKDISDLHKKISEQQYWLAIEEMYDICSSNTNTTKHFKVFNNG